MVNNARWWTCPSCGDVVPVSYQLEESFDDETGRAEFDPSEHLAPARDGTLTASWMAVVRCPNHACDQAWVFTLYPAEKSLFAAEVA
jgi:hypothetical protein